MSAAMVSNTTDTAATALNAASSRSCNDPRRSVITAEPELVANTEYRLHDRRVMVTEFAAQVLDVRVDGPLVAGELVAAHPVDQLIARKDPARRGGHRRQKPPLGRSQLQRPAVQCGL